MRSENQPGLHRDGLISSVPDENAEIPFSTAILCQYLISVFRITDVPPWGLILPMVGAESEAIQYNFEAETWDMPEGTLIGVRWSPHSGNNAHVVTHQVPGGGPFSIIIPIPDNWLFECEGQSVLIEYEASLPDGSIRRGRSFDVSVGRKIGYGNVTIADLKNDDVVIPEKYPDGIAVTIDPIVNGEVYNHVRFNWRVNGYSDNHLPQTIALSRHHMPYVPGSGYEVVVPPDCYTDLDLTPFTRVAVIATTTFYLLPEPHMEMMWGFGGHTFWLKP